MHEYQKLLLTRTRGMFNIMFSIFPSQFYQEQQKSITSLDVTKLKRLSNSNNKSPYTIHTSSHNLWSSVASCHDQNSQNPILLLFPNNCKQTPAKPPDIQLKAQAAIFFVTIQGTIPRSTNLFTWSGSKISYLHCKNLCFCNRSY